MEEQTETEIAKSSFLARMSHEMRTPLNAIIGMCTIAQTSPEPGKINDCLVKISEASLHLLRMINEILDLAKIETGEFVLVNAEFNFIRMLEKIVDNTKFSLDAKVQVLNVELDPDLPERIIADEMMFTHVLNALLSNAVKFTPPNGTITLIVKMLEKEEEKCSIGIWIRDTGIGISEEAMQNIFTIFEQADGGLSREYEGTGLGLTISSRIVSLMGGEIHVESELGKGSCFSFSITVDLPEDEAHKQTGSQEEGSRYAGLTIILAEDVEINQEIIIMLLEDTGVTIECADNGLIALEKYKAGPEKYSAVIMDIHMPEMDGYESSRQIRIFEKENSLRRIPIIAITANVFQSDVEKSLEAGMDCHLGKPVDLDELMAALDKHLLG